MILLAVSLAFMLVSASYTATMFTLAFIWGIGISCIGLALQMRVPVSYTHLHADFINCCTDKDK